MNINIQDLVKRHFWVVGVLTLVACTFFAGRAVAHVIEAKALTDAVKAPEVAAPARTSVAPTSEARNKAGKPLSDRNIFCSECLPAVATATTTTPTDGPIETQLPLSLIATSIGDNFRMATVLATDSQLQGGYLLGNAMPGAGKIVAISYQHVDFVNPAAGGRVERLSLVKASAPTPDTTVATATIATPPVGNDPLAAAIDAGIHKNSDTDYEVDRSLIDQVLANPMAMAKGARAIPTPQGIKLAAMRPNSAYTKLGLKNGDTIAAVNGDALDSLQSSLAVFQKVQSASDLQIDVVRGGKPVQLHYKIR